MQNQQIHNESALKPRIPKWELKKLIDASFTYERRKFIFWSFNTTYLGIALFQIISDVNLEGGDNPSLCLDANLDQTKSESCPLVIFNLIIVYNVAHLCQVIAGITGYFGIDQKSKKINKGYQLLLIFSCIMNAVVAIILISQVGKLQATPFENMTDEFLMLLIMFPLFQSLICYFCLAQFRKASIENFNVQQEKENLIEKHSQMVYDVAKYFITI